MRVVLAELTMRGLQKAIDELARVISRLEDRGFGKPLKPNYFVIPTSM